MSVFRVIDGLEDTPVLKVIDGLDETPVLKVIDGLEDAPVLKVIDGLDETPVRKVKDGLDDTPVLRVMDELDDTPVRNVMDGLDDPPVLRLIGLVDTPLAEGFEEKPVLSDTEDLLEMLVPTIVLDEETLVPTIVLDDETLVPTMDLDEEALVPTSDLDDETLVPTRDLDDETLVPTRDLDDETLVPIMDLDEETLVPIMDLDEETLVPIMDLDDEKLVLTAVELAFVEEAVLSGSDAVLAVVLRGTADRVAGTVELKLFLDEVGVTLTIGVVSMHEQIVLMNCGSWVKTLAQIEDWAALWAGDDAVTSCSPSFLSRFSTSSSVMVTAEMGTFREQYALAGGYVDSQRRSLNLSDEHASLLTGDAEMRPRISKEISKLNKIIERAMSLALTTNLKSKY